MSGPPREGAIVFCVGAVQFVNILDFMMVMPLGPDFARTLGIPLSHLGYVGGSYTAAAAISGVAGAFFLDRFDRRSALTVTMLGLVVGTFAGSLAVGLRSLMLARIVAGAFGGPATSVSYSIIADVIPLERRGRAMGAVMGAFSVASVLGVPAGLELAQRGSWKLPFVAVALLGAVLAGFAYVRLPSMTGHRARVGDAAAKATSVGRDIAHLFRTDVLVALTMTFAVMASGFVLFPNVAAYILNNLGYPRERLGILYLAGGVVSFGTMRLAGSLVDRHGSARIALLGTALCTPIIYMGYGRFPPLIPPLATFVGMMLAMAFRNVAYNTLMSKVPAPEERARFSSIQSAVQHLAASLAAFTAAAMLTELPDHRLEGMGAVASVSIVLCIVVVPLVWVVEAQTKRRAYVTRVARG